MKIINLKKKLGTFVLDIRYAELESGRVHGFIGGNGSGKTTLAKLLAGILKPDEGEILYEGLDPRSITMTTQKPYMLHTSVYENLVYPLKIRGIKPNETEIDAMLKKHDLFLKKTQYARTLSSGEQQKLSFLRTLIFKPKLVIVDETLSNLSAESLELFENLILEIQKVSSITWVIISHQTHIINKLCDNVLFFSNGQLIESGKKEQVFFHSENPIVKTYVQRQAFGKVEAR
jgi:ABC-type multidrug transport system ATPase subunit